MSDRVVSAFDVFLLRGCDSLPDLEMLGAFPLSPELAQRILQSTALSEQPGVVPGFLGLSLTKRLAWELMGRLGALGATGDILEVAYRTPRISPEEACGIAERTLANWLAAQKSVYTYEPMRRIESLTHEKARCWVFFARSPEAQEQGYIPGGAMLSVDKVDGHIWSRQDLELIGWEWDRLLYLFPDWRDGIYGDPPWILFQR